MTTHYYTNNDELESHERTLEFHFKEQVLKFISDDGVFSKNRIDYGSRVLLELFEYQSWMETLLDVGCGYGAISLSLKKVYPIKSMTLVDVNDRAMNLARKNAIVNKLDSIEVLESNAYANVKEMYHVVVSNPPIRAGKQVVFSILEGAYDHLYPKGELWIVIQKKQGAPSAMKKMEEVFGNVEVVGKDKGYYILKSKKQ